MSGEIQPDPTPPWWERNPVEVASRFEYTEITPKPMELPTTRLLELDMERKKDP